MTRSNQYQVRHSQNFLKNPRLVEHLVELADIGENDTIVEIGPGRGAITLVLARVAGHVLAIEHDPDLARHLASKGNLPANVTVITADVLQVQMPSSQYRVFANIPFRHTAAIIGKLTTGIAPPVDAWLIVQREAAERYLVAGRKTMQAISLAPWFTISICHYFERRDFSPRPNVDSVMICIKTRPNPLLPDADRKRFQQMVDVLFGAWTPSLRDAVKARLPRLAAQHVVRNLNIDWHEKPSSLALDGWIRLYRELVGLNDERVWSDLARHANRQEENRRSLQRPTRTKAGQRNSR